MTVLSITYNKNLWPFNVTMQHHSLNTPTFTRCMHEPWKHAIYSTSCAIIFNICGMYNHMFMLIALCIFYMIIISYCVTSIHCYLAHFITRIHFKMGALIHWHKPTALPLGTKHNNMNVNKSTHTHHLQLALYAMLGEKNNKDSIMSTNTKPKFWSAY